MVRGIGRTQRGPERKVLKRFRAPLGLKAEPGGRGAGQERGEGSLTPPCQSSSGFICSTISCEKSTGLIKVMYLGSLSGIYELCELQK